MINRVVIVGNLTRDPELKPTKTGTPVVTFTVALDGRQKDAEGKYISIFIPVVVFGQAAESVSERAKKGMLVGVDGHLNQRTYERTKDKVMVTVTEVIADSVRILTPRKKTEDDVDTPVFDDTVNEGSEDYGSEEESSNVDALNIPDEDLPF